MIVVDVERISDSCGWGVPIMEFVADRDIMRPWAEKKGPDGLVAYRAQKNARSLDGLPALVDDRAAGSIREPQNLDSLLNLSVRSRTLLVMSDEDADVRGQGLASGDESALARALRSPRGAARSVHASRLRPAARMRRMP